MSILQHSPTRDSVVPKRSELGSGLASPSDELKRLLSSLTRLEILLQSGNGPMGRECAEILGLVRSIEISLIARQIHHSLCGPATTAPEPDDAWLTPDEVAKRLRHSRAWVYRQARRWPFARRPSRKVLLISEHGLTRWLEHR